VLHALPQSLRRLLLLDLQSVVVVDHEDFRHEPGAHGVALAECAVHDHSHAILLSPTLTAGSRYDSTLDIDDDKEPRMSIVPIPTTALTLDEINLASFDFWLRDDMEGALAKLRHERPIAWHQHPDSGKGFWSLTRYDDVAAATRDWETFSSAYGIQVMTDPEDMQRLGAIRSMISTDPPKHTKLRAVVNRGFTPKMVARAEDSVRQRAREIVDAIAPKGEVEFVAEVASVLPVAII